MKKCGMYNIRYSPHIFKDIKRLSKADAKIIKSSIESKLAIDPIEYGKPLRHSLKGMRRLRVGSYRVVFHIEKETVYIETIAHRKDIYK